MSSSPDILAEVIRQRAEEPFADYWKSLGRFIHFFARTEHKVLTLLREQAKVSEKVAGAIFSGTRADAAKGLITRLLETHGLSDVAARLKGPFDQLGLINSARNDLVHWGTTYREGELSVSNAHLFPPPNRAISYPVTTELLGNMTDDLFKIGVAIDLERLPQLSNKDFLDFLSRPWRYKPRGQAPKTRPPKAPASHRRSPVRRQKKPPQ